MDKMVSDLRRLAVTKNMAIVLISQMTTRIRDEARAMLYPAIAGNAWEGGVATRIVLYRDWWSQNLKPSSQKVDHPGMRIAGVIKAKGVSYEAIGRLTAFQITNNGLEEVPIDAAEMRNSTSPMLPSTSLKRRHNEISDSQSETGDAASDHDFAWDDETTLEAGIFDE